MKALQIVAATFLAPCVAAVPYFMMIALAFFGAANEGGAPAQVALLFFSVVSLGTILAIVFLACARLSWKTKSMVVREHLFGWPIGLAALIFIIGAVPGVLAGVVGFLLVLASSLICGVVGCLAARLWLKLSYPDKEEAYSIDSDSRPETH